MRSILFCILAIAVSTPTLAKSVRVKGYTTKTGKYVAPHYRSSPDRSRLNNWSTRGNVNPYTGKAGTQNPYPSYNSYGYGRTRSYVPGYSRPTYGYTGPSYSYTPPSYGYASPSYEDRNSGYSTQSPRAVQRRSGQASTRTVAKQVEQSPIYLPSGVSKLPARTASGFCIDAPWDYVGTGSVNYPAVTSAMPRCPSAAM